MGWALVVAIIFVYLVLGYPLLLTVVVWALVREIAHEIFQNDVLIVLAERFNLSSNEIQEIIRVNPHTRHYSTIRRAN